MRSGILVINAGSSSIKFAGYADGEAAQLQLLGKGEIEGLRTQPTFEIKNERGEVIDQRKWDKGDALAHGDALEFLIGWIESNAKETRVTAAGHRVVHGGLGYARPVLIDDAVFADLEKLVPLAPLHQPHNLAAIRSLAELDPDLPQVACFDTAFHRTLPPVAEMFALPRAMTEQGIRRYGFHGLSYEYIAGRLPQVVPGASRVVVAHLGSGASMCAIRDGKSIESTMGFTAVDGLPMGTRTGALDPGVVLYFMQSLGMDDKAIETLLYNQSGLLGVSGISNDMRALLASDDPRAEEAVALFVYHVAKHAAALAAAMGGIDALVFTAGIGENAAPVRERVCARLAWLGIDLDDDGNRRGGPRISKPGSAVSAWVIPTDEERMIARHTARVLAETPR